MPVWAVSLCAPTTLLLLLVLTNDAHQFVFSFPDGVVWSDNAYHYQIGYWCILVWILLCALSALTVMLAKRRAPQERHLLPFVPVALSALYVLLYILNVP